MMESTGDAKQAVYPLPLRLGFFLARMGVTCSSWPSVQYRGVDRDPNLPSSEEDDELRSAGRGRFVNLIDRYWDAEYSGELHVNKHLAHDLQCDFIREGVQLEVIYHEITVIPSPCDEYPNGALWSKSIAEVLPRTIPIHDRFAQRPNNLRFLGFDLAYPVPHFHSAIFQPGLHITHPSLPEHLNPAGLFTDLSVALPFLHAANELGYGDLPFCIIGVWESLSQ